MGNVIFTKDSLEKVLNKHYKWTRGKDGGERADLEDARLRRISLSYANLSFANLKRVDLEGSFIEHGNLEHIKLNEANLKDTSLCNTDLSYAEIKNSDLTNTNLPYTNLRGVSLKNSNLENAKLDYVNLTNADLRNVNLKNASLLHTNTDSVRGCSVYSYQIPIDDGDTTINTKISYWKDPDVWTLDNRQGNKEEIIDYINSRFKDENKDNFLKSIEFIENMAKQNG